MATGFLSGLLGQDEEATPEQQARNNALLMAGLQGLMASGPSLVPTSFGQILGQAGMTGLGAYNESLQQAQSNQMAQEMQQALSGGEVQPSGSGVADRYRQFAIKLSATDPQKANLYLQMADKLEGDVGKFTGNAANLAFSMYGTANVNDLTPEQRQTVMNTLQQQSTAAARAGAPNVNVKYGESFGTKLAGQQVEMISQSQADASSAAQTINTVNSMLPLIEQSFTGPGSTAQTFLAQVGQQLGIGGADREQVLSNTANLIKGAAQLELDAAGKLKGQGNITENERAILRRAESVEIAQMTAPELTAVLTTLESVAAKRMSVHNSLLNRFIETQDPSVARQLELYRVAPPVPVRRK